MIFGDEDDYKYNAAYGLNQYYQALIDCQLNWKSFNEDDDDDHHHNSYHLYHRHDGDDDDMIRHTMAAGVQWLGFQPSQGS